MSAAAKFSSIEELCHKLGGTKPVKALLIANNGLAAVKGIRSIREWTYDHLGDPRAIRMCVMATPEDLDVNSSFITMADANVPVPGGTNANNYANVDLIVRTARQLHADAVYPGWGHASENPALPRKCDETGTVTFLGPSEGPMFALGDKIASTIIAQSNGVPCVPWSGDSIMLPPGTFQIPPELYEQAYVRTAAECEAQCQRIGFPCMIKASEGGGGKGIRKVTRAEDVASLFTAVQEEVKGCHIFVMRMLDNVRHLEVQLLADKYGQCIAVRTRDCSVQRRHQKIIEEGPVFGVDPAVVRGMEEAAIRLAKAVNYCGLGTVEYMYNKQDGTFCFLELNPRIQVEHPVSELISNVNLPAALLCVGMGIPLHRIPEVRAYYGRDPYGDTPIDFDREAAPQPRKHTIAVRVTAEDVDEGFRPTTGKIDQLTFHSTKECWGYFSVPSSDGGVHQFADSQFGHIFSTADTREGARAAMVLALQSLTVRGEIRTSSNYVMELLEMHEFRTCDISTSWLDRLIADRLASRAALPSTVIFPALAAAAIMRLRREDSANVDKYTAFLRSGHVPSADYLQNGRTETFVVKNTKYVIDAAALSSGEYALRMNNTTIVVPCREFSTGALQMTLGGRTVIAYGEEEPTSLRITINGRATTLTGDVDPTKLRSQVPGRLVRFVVPDGGHVEEGAPYAEVEVMKMILPLKSSVSGTLKVCATAGSTVTIGKLLADVEPDDVSKVSRPVDSADTWPEELLTASRSSDRLDAVGRARLAVEELWNLINGYHPKCFHLETRVKEALDNLRSLCLSTVSLELLNQPFLAPHSAGAVSPTDKVGAVYACIIDCYAEVEQWFDGCTRQDGVERLREAKGDDAAAVLAIDFAHHHAHRHVVVKMLLQHLEENRTLMLKCQPLLLQLSKLQGQKGADFGPVKMQALFLLRQCAQDSFDERRQKMSKALESGELLSMMQTSFGFDVLCAVMFDPRAPHLAQQALELFVRRSYFGVGPIEAVDVLCDRGTWQATWRYTEQPGLTPLFNEDSSGFRHSAGYGFAFTFFDEETMGRELAPRIAAGHAQIAHTNQPMVAYAFIAVRHEVDQKDVAQRLTRLMVANQAALQATALHHITFIAQGNTAGPHIFTLSRDTSDNFGSEYTLYRNLIPNTVRRLELQRITQNYNVEMFPTPNRAAHVFIAKPKKDKPAPIETRIFVRMYVSPGDIGAQPGEVLGSVMISEIIRKFLDAARFTRTDKALRSTVFNHLFVNLINLTIDVSQMHNLLKEMADAYAKEFFRNGFREAELRFIAQTAEGPVPIRAYAMNHTGYALEMCVFAETTAADGSTVLIPARYNEDIVAGRQMPSVPPSMSTGGALDELEGMAARSGAVAQSTELNADIQRRLAALKSQLPSRSEAVPAPAGSPTDSPASKRAPHQRPPPALERLQPYPQMTTKQKNRLTAQETQTTYVHDWSILFTTSLRARWKAFVAARGLSPAIVPSTLLTATPMYCDLPHGGPLKQGAPPAACGMLAWVFTIRAPTYYDLDDRVAHSRDVVIVANDITYQGGSFAVAEDAVFKSASDYARKEGLPFVYLSANSGARLGLSNEVKEVFRVALRDADRSLDYLYLTPADLAALNAKGAKVITEAVHTAQGELRHKITDIIGTDADHIGVENLQGSALIAGHMSLNYSTIPTISVATGRSVGIGAYLNRLGRRIVQTGNTPIILTGAKALNRLLGKEVYTSEAQLGGAAIMQPNGVTHWGATDDLDAVGTVLRWLDSVPAKVDAARPSANLPRTLTTEREDPIDRDVTFTPARDVPYDPRLLVTGEKKIANTSFGAGDGSSQAEPAYATLGMFDQGSFVESLSSWAKTVVTGRATLGGIPCGVILVETRITKRFDPADPADPASTSSFSNQAGQVWFPDSARKTADALEDFHKEHLPAFILANWRGFSGGMRDMYDQVLKFGASIVDNLRQYDLPVFIYIPPFGELRGGAWVVVDPVINHKGCVEMYTDVTARGGILEPSGVVEIKYRAEDVAKTMRRNHPELAALDESARRKREQQLQQVYSNDVTVAFADMHDTPCRMKAKKCIVDIVPWRDARRVFAVKLARRLEETRWARDAMTAGIADAPEDALRLVRQWAAESGAPVASDAATAHWLKAEGRIKMLAHIGVAASAAAARRVTTAIAAAAHAAVQDERSAAAEVFAALLSGPQGDSIRAAMQAALSAQKAL